MMSLSEYCLNEEVSYVNKKRIKNLLPDKVVYLCDIFKTIPKI